MVLAVRALRGRRNGGILNGVVTVQNIVHHHQVSLP